MTEEAKSVKSTFDIPGFKWDLSKCTGKYKGLFCGRARVLGIGGQICNNCQIRYWERGENIYNPHRRKS